MIKMSRMYVMEMMKILHPEHEVELEQGLNGYLQGEYAIQLQILDHMEKQIQRRRDQIEMDIVDDITHGIAPLKAVAEALHHLKREEEAKAREETTDDIPF